MFVFKKNMINKKIYLILTLFLVSTAADLSAKKFNNLNVINSKKDTSEFNLKKFNEGIDFYGMGNEPFWAVDIAIDHHINFNTMNGMSLNTGYVKGEKAMDANVMRFVTQTDSGLFTVTIYEGECSDNMSGEKFSYKVIVEFNNPGDADYKKFEGCGRYVPNYGLNKKWTLKKLGDNEITSSNFKNGLPELQIDIERGRFGGNAGCNRITGSLWSEYNLIRFNDPAITMMACEDMEKEKEFLNALKKTTQFKINGNELILSNPDSVTMVFYDPDVQLNESFENDDSSRVYRLHDIWLLESINGETADGKNFMKELPQIEINTTEMNFSGSGGCNRINGIIEVKGNSIKFDRIISTRMMCPGTGERDFLAALQNVNAWSIEKNKLYLIQDGKTVIVFKKID